MRQGFATFKKETRMAQYLPELFELRAYYKIKRIYAQLRPIIHQWFAIALEFSKGR